MTRSGKIILFLITLVLMLSIPRIMIGMLSLFVGFLVLGLLFGGHAEEYGGMGTGPLNGELREK